MSRSLQLKALLGLSTLLTAAGSALAQAQANAPLQLSPPTPGRVDDPPVIMNILVLLLVAALIVGAFLIPAKRGHQD
jgi:hypothetical protein